MEDQKKLVDQITARMPFHWKLIFINYEMKSFSDDMESSDVSFCISSSIFGKIERKNFELSVEDNILIHKIGRAFMEREGSRYMTMDIIIDRKREPSIYLDFEKPLRLSSSLVAAAEVQKIERYLRYMHVSSLFSKI